MDIMIIVPEQIDKIKFVGFLILDSDIKSWSGTSLALKFGKGYIIYNT